MILQIQAKSVPHDNFLVKREIRKDTSKAVLYDVFLVKNEIRQNMSKLGPR